MARGMEKGRRILSMVDGWMGSSGNEFCLGTSEYTLADVFLTVMMMRLTLNKEYF